MPRYYFKCECGECTGVIRPAAKQRDPLACKTCGKEMKRDPRGATSKIVETLDNGIMSRRVERIADAERIVKERSKLQDDREP